MHQVHIPLYRIFFQNFKKIICQWHLFFYPLLWLFLRAGYKIKVHGDLQRYKREPNLILASNHLSFLDPPLLLDLFGNRYFFQDDPAPLFFIARKSLFRFPFIGALFKKYGAYPLALDGNRASELFDRLAPKLKSGGRIIIFPEGTRSATGRLGPIKKGAVRLASLSQATILPIYIKGTFEAWPRTKVFPRFFKQIDIFIGKEIPHTFYASTEAECNTLAVLDLKEYEEGVLKKLAGELEYLESHASSLFN